MSIPTLTVLLDNNQSEKENSTINKFLSWLVPQMVIDEVDLFEKKSVGKIALSTASHLVSQSIILRGPLKNLMNTPVSPEQVLSQCLGTHTCVHAFLSPNKFNFFLVSDAPKEDISPVSDEISHNHMSFHAAVALTDENDPCVHAIGYYPENFTELFPGVQVISLSFSECISKLFKNPELFRVIHASYEHALFIKEMLKEMQKDAYASSLIEIGHQTMVFSYQEALTVSSLLFTISLLLKHLAYTETAKSMESAIIDNWDYINSHPLSELEEKLHEWIDLKPIDQKDRSRKLSGQFYDLSIQKIDIQGFDIMIIPSIPIQQLGDNLQNFCSSQPFYLDSIGFRNLCLYPNPPINQSVSCACCCRFLAHDKTLMMKDIGLFIDRISCMYQWIQIAMLYEFNGKKNFRSFYSKNENLF